MSGEGRWWARWLSALLLVSAVLIPSYSAAPQNPVLTVRPEEGEKTAAGPLRIGMLGIVVDVTGHTARTVVTTRFLNTESHDLEGDFTFDLPSGSVVTGYALDIRNKMVDGVLAEPRQATLTFNARVRRGIDPGLAGVTRTGAFQTRVYPILEKIGRVVQLRFVTALEPDRPFVIPLVTERPVKQVSILVRTDAATPPALKGPGGVDLAWKKHGKGFEARLELENRVLSGGLVLSPAQPGKAVALARHHSGKVFFDISDAAPAAARQELRPAHVRLYWDSSRSRRDADLTREIDLATRYVDEIRPAQLDLVLFSTGKPAVRSFLKPKGSEIATALKEVDFHGGTSLRSLVRADLPAAEVCLLFTDGSITVDSSSAPDLACKLFTISSAADANRALLTALGRSGGYIDLAVRETKSAVAALLGKLPRVSGVTGQDGKPLDYQMLPAADGRYHIVGRLPASGDIVVNIANAATGQKRYAVDRSAIASDDGPAALWAARRIDEMSGVERPARKEILALSRQYSVANAFASFVVFENADDYVEAGTPPPAGALSKEDMADYVRMKEEHDKDKAADLHDRPDNIAKLWDEQKDWWKAEFDPKSAKKRLRPARGTLHHGYGGSFGGGGGFTGGGCGDDDTGCLETVVVTGMRAAAPSSDKTIVIAITPWTPDRPYIAKLNEAKPGDIWKVYRELEGKYGDLPAYYLDVAEFMYRHGRAQSAARIVLSALELPTTNTTTMTIVADRLMRYGEEERALWLYRRIAWLEPDRPQPLRNLALALIKRADKGEAKDQQRQDYRRALDLLNEIITHDWPGAYDGIEVIALMEANRIVPRLKALGVNKLPLDPRLISPMDVDLRVVLEWNTDETDMDLWVDEPTGERAMYSNPSTALGGRLSDDMTQGYGPEEYLLHRAPDGTYTVRTNVYATDRLNPNGANTVTAHVFHDYGRANEREETLELELKRSDKSDKQGIEIGKVVVGTAK